MEETFYTQAIILNKQPWREDGTRVILYGSAGGKMELIARGARKSSSKLAAHIEPITLAKVMGIRGRNYDYIGSAISENCYAGIKNDLGKLVVAGKAIRLFDRSVREGESDENLFRLLSAFLASIDADGGKNDLELSFSLFSLKLLSALGYKPELYDCVICRNRIRAGGNAFDLKKGGVVCRQCQEKEVRKRELTLSDDCIKVLRMASGEELGKVLKLKLDREIRLEINKIIKFFTIYHGL